MGHDTDFAIKLAQLSSCLDAIAGCDQRPGHVAYLTKAEAVAIAQRALRIVEALAEQVSA